MDLVPTMDYVSGPILKWRDLYIISTKTGINIWLYLKTENGLKICCLDENYDCTNGLVVRNRAKMIVHTSNYITSHPSSLLGSSPVMSTTQSALISYKCIENHVIERLGAKFL
jgi:hypothetical protein